MHKIYVYMKMMEVVEDECFFDILDLMEKKPNSYIINFMLLLKGYDICH